MLRLSIFALLLLVLANTTAQIPTEGLKGYWKLDGNTLDNRV